MLDCVAPRVSGAKGVEDDLQLGGMIDSFSLVGEAAGKLGFSTIGALGLLTVATDLTAAALITSGFGGVGMTVLSGGSAGCCWKGSIFAMIVVVVVVVVVGTIIGAVTAIVVEPVLVWRGLVIHGNLMDSLNFMGMLLWRK